MNGARIADVQHAAFQAQETLLNLRRALEAAHREAGSGSHNQQFIEFATESVLNARVAVSVARQHLGVLKCATVPCDRSNGICPKCGDRAAA